MLPRSYTLMPLNDAILKIRRYGRDYRVAKDATLVASSLSLQIYRANSTR